MDTKLALVDSIENIKEKITSQEYKDILENLAKVTVAANEYVKNIRSSNNSDANSDANSDEPTPTPTPTRVQFGFARPVKISLELSAFIGVENELISRPDVTKALTNYVKEHNLQKLENKRIIDLNKPGGEPLRILLKVPNEQELTFFNMQIYLKDHFIVGT